MVYDARMTATNTGTEAKWPADEPGHARLRETLRRLNATHLSTTDETNTLFDTPDASLRADGHVLRLRTISPGGTLLTFKGPATYSDGVKTRDETELSIADRAAMQHILSGLGYQPSLEYHKRRETWQIDSALVALDTLDFGRFVEIEGSDEQVRRIAAQVGLRMDDAIEKGYPALMRAHLARDER